MDNKYAINFEDRTFYIDREIAEKYDKEVRPLDNIDVLKYLFVAFDLDISSDTLENDFTEALKEELTVAKELPGAIEKAKKEGFFD